MNKLEKFLAKATEPVVHTEVEEIIDGERWNVRKLNLVENRLCEREASKGDDFDWYRYNDARIVKATEHDFNWNDPELLRAYKAANKFELPGKLFNHNIDAYAALLEAVRRVNQGQTEAEAIEEAKN
ncbi:hypothetical protein [Brevibacillus daliensis]|uniref:hypothetical protein n=1 Tax=Brevibacillus daliensis TaxID=2892995 RepID=UPI001E5FD6E7|nr:hypothetical protein [Brevibacillus daliensis]